MNATCTEACSYASQTELHDAEPVLNHCHLVVSGCMNVCGVTKSKCMRMMQVESRGIAQPQARRERKANTATLSLTEGLSHLVTR